MELKTLIEDGNKTITALRAEVDSIKSEDVVSSEKLAKIEADLAANLSAKQEAELALKAMEKRLEEVETKASRPAGGAKAEMTDEYKEAFIAFIRNPGNPTL
jgi:chromosome segregation ATPase